MPLVENQFGHGGLGHFLKQTDWQYVNFSPKNAAPFDWSTGYDIESVIERVIPSKNQGVSGSCGGQAVSYYTSVLKAVIGGTFAEKSAKFIYAPVAQPGGGSYGGDLMNRVKNVGSSSEVTCPSYQDGNPPTEAFMEDTSSITNNAITDAASTKSIGYSFIIDFDIDTLAQAVRDNYGIIIAVIGENNGTWLSAFPQPPKTQQWAHWLYVGKVKMINGKKYLGVKNSWGDNVGELGWQWIGEDYVQAGVELGMVMTIGVQPYMFNYNLYLGMTDSSVYFLQKQLNKNSQTQVAQSGPGSPGNETYYFGSLTQAAVKKFQQLHGITPVSGYCGPKTRAVLNINK